MPGRLRPVSHLLTALSVTWILSASSAWLQPFSRRRWAMRAPVAPALVLSMAASLRRLWAADFCLSYHVSPEKAPYRR